MIGLGTIINTGTVILGGILGLLFGKCLKERHQDILITANGICVIFIGLSGALEHLLQVTETGITSGKGMFLIACLVVGGLIGEIINIEGLFERFGEWLKKKTGNAKDQNFVNGFITTSLTVSIGAMAIVGSIQDGISGDYSILLTKAILDLITVMVMTASLGKGCIFSALPIFVLQGSMTLLATIIKPYLTDLVIANISLIGSILIFCIGINLTFKKKLRVANYLPALIIAVILAFIPGAMEYLA